ncbi:unnamed protein product [Rotaria sp. Silwood1]|nr:unnamed protein product [Rotaria sp. Silwood1]CAF4659579.1 unnamed protein product [Rotaria sp. Silwood1]
MSSERTETNHQHQSYRKLGTHALNKTDEHCRSLFNLLPTSLRPRHYYHHRHRQTSNKKGVDASITTTTTTQPSSSNDIIRTDYDSGYMSQSLLNRTSSYASCYSAVATIMPISSITRHGSIESLLHGHSKSNPANIRIIVRKNFEPFAQAHINVTKGTIVTALFSRGPWLYVRIDSNGKTGYIPRIICSLYDNKMLKTNNLSISSTDSSFSKDDEINILKISSNNEKNFHYKYKQPINRYLSHSSAIINNNHINQRIEQISFDERERRNTYTLPRPPRSNLSSSKDRRLTVSSINYPSSTNKQSSINMNNEISTTNINNIIPTRDTDSSSTQDSGYSESTPFFLVQQSTPDNEQPSSHSIINASKKPLSTPHYATVRRSVFLKIPDSINPSQPNQKQIHSTRNHRHTLLNGISMNDMINNDSSKRHTFGTFDRNTTNTKDNSKENLNLKISTKNSVSRLRDFALIRNVRQDKSQLQQRLRPSIYNLPKSHIQIPASIFLNHHRQKQQFGSSHSAFRPVQPTIKHKRASSEGHSPSISTASSSSSSLSSSNSSLNVEQHFSKRRRLSCDLPVPLLSKLNSNSLTRSVCDQSSPSSSIKLNNFSRTMSDIICDQFSEINIDAIEKDSLIHHQPKKLQNSKHCLFTIIKDYRSSRGSFSVQRGDCVYILKQIGQACYLVRKQTNGQIGFLPKTLLQPATSTRIDTFLETHGFRETVI